jgi:CHAT domain-containing protein/Tfp pilus assembly protein PilF
MLKIGALVVAVGLAGLAFSQDDKQFPTPEIQDLIDAAAKLPLKDAITALEAALPKAIAAKDVAGEAAINLNCGLNEENLWLPADAEKHYERALKLYRGLKAQDEIARSLNGLGEVRANMGRNQEALACFEEALPIEQQSLNLKAQEVILGNTGLAYSNLSQKQKALEYYGQSLDIAQKTDDREEQAVMLHDIGTIYSDLGQNEKALNYFQQALPIELALGNRMMAGNTQIGLGRLYSDMGQNQKALEFYQEALPEEREGGNRRAEATILTNMGASYSYLGQTQKALDFCEQALEVEREIKSRIGEGTVLSNEGRIYSDMGQDQKALDLYRQALSIQRETGDRVGEENALGNIGKSYMDLGQNQKALDFFGQALTIAREVGIPKDEASILSNTASVYSHLGQNQRALDLYGQALALKRKVADRSGEASMLGNIGTVDLLTGKDQEALGYFQQSLAIEKEIGEKSGEATALSNLGAVYSDLGVMEKSFGFSEQALTLRREVGDRSGEALTLGNIGALYSKFGREDEALGFYEKALPIQQEIGDKRGEALTYGNIGAAYMALNKNEEALSFYNKALPIERAVGDRAEQAITLSNEGAAFQNLGMDDKALEADEQALPIEREVGDRSTEAITSRSLETLYAKEEPELAIWYGKHAVNLYQSLRRDISGLDKQTRNAFKESVSVAYRQLADLLAGQGRIGEAEQVLRLLKEDELFEYVRRSERGLIDENADYTPDEAAWDKEYEAQTAGLADLARQVEELKASGGDASKLDALNDELAKREQLFQGFLKRVLERAAVMGVDTEKLKLATGADLEAKSVSGPLAKMSKKYPGVVAVYAFVAPDALRLFYFSPGHMQGRVSVIKEADLNKKILAFRQALTNPLVDPRPLGKELYDLLVRPIEPDLAGTKATRIMWSLDGQLRYLPVAALYDGKQYLVEKYDLSLFTPADMADLVLPSSVKWTGLVAGVSKAHTVTEADGHVDVFAGLSGVPGELEGVKAAVPGSTELLDAQFTDASFVHALNRSPTLVHLATHFAFRPGDETQSYLLTGDGKPFRVADARTLSEASLQGVSLLTLSACETALGSSDGSEVESISVVLEKKGAESVLATLWPVADASTALLMSEFYKLREGHPEWTKAHALREAQVAMLRGALVGKGTGTRSVGVSKAAVSGGFSHPYYWAPFVLSGNWK